LGRRGARCVARVDSQRIIRLEFSIGCGTGVGIAGERKSGGAAICLARVHTRTRRGGRTAGERRKALRMAIPVVIVGMGPRGCNWLREVEASPAFAAVACVDTDEQVLKNACNLEVSASRRYTDLQTAIENVLCRAAIVATPADEHAEPCKIALNAGLAVMVE